MPAVDDLATLAARRSEKWEQPLRRARLDDRGDGLRARSGGRRGAAPRRSTGTTSATRRPRRAASTRRSPASPRGGWTGRVDPEQVALVPDVMVGADRARADPGRAGRRRRLRHAAYPPFLVELPEAGLAIHELPLAPDGALDLGALDAALAAGVRRADPREPAQPDRPRAAARRAGADRGDVRRARRVGARGRDPCAARPPGAPGTRRGSRSPTPPARAGSR